MDKKPSILIIEDHPIVRDGLAARFENTDNFKVSGKLSNLDEAKKFLSKEMSDILLLDIELEDGLGLHIIPWLKNNIKQNEKLPVFAVYSTYDDFVHISAALGLGVMVYMTKRRSADELERALLQALEGKKYIDESIEIKFNTTKDIFSLLTNREAQILTLVNEGLSDKEIASRLGISVRTVQNIVYCIFAKTGIHSRKELQRL
ncbi:MAG: response regulator transcription factor [Treponema sp.]|nr:response regulator transcription factor [Treponema sp.]